MNTRIYAVTIKGDPSATVRFVSAATKAQAVNHVANGMISAKPATVEQAIEFARNNGVVENAGEGEQA